MSRRTDGRHCGFCGARVVFVETLGRIVPVEPGPPVRCRIAGGPAGSKEALVSVLLPTGWCPRVWLDPEGEQEGRLLHTPRCPDWRPEEPEKGAPPKRLPPKRPKAKRGVRV